MFLLIPLLKAAGLVSKWALGHIAPEHRTQVTPFLRQGTQRRQRRAQGRGVALHTCSCHFLTRKLKQFEPHSLIQHMQIAVGSDG